MTKYLHGIKTKRWGHSQDILRLADEWAVNLFFSGLGVCSSIDPSHNAQELHGNFSRRPCYRLQEQTRRNKLK